MSRSAPMVEAPPPVHPEKRYVYNGEPPTVPQGDFMPRGNRPVKRRKRSPFNIIVSLIIISALTVCFIWNKIAVNHLAVDVNDLQNQYQRIESNSEIARSEINKKSSLERIGTLAGQMGMTYPKTQPIWFEVKHDDLEKIPTK